MLKAEQILVEAPSVDDTLTLPFQLRQRSRLVTTLQSGREILLALPRGRVLRDRALLQTTEGLVVEVRAAPETLSVVESENPVELARVAYHLGNRHVALQIDGGGLRYLHDHVLDDMVQGLGLPTRVVTAPFEPEAGAYGGHAGRPGHEHEHEQGHGHGGDH
jgi:urease accessory protein